MLLLVRWKERTADPTDSLLYDTLSLRCQLSMSFFALLLGRLDVVFGAEEVDEQGHHEEDGNDGGQHASYYDTG